MNLVPVYDNYTPEMLIYVGLFPISLPKNNVVERRHTIFYGSALVGVLMQTIESIGCPQAGLAQRKQIIYIWSNVSEESRHVKW